MKPIPQIQKYMSVSPHTVGDDQPLAKASEIMRLNHIRHLPVMHGGKVVGVISDRDVSLMTSFKDVDLANCKVSDAMTEAPYIVSPASMLDSVALEMAEKHYGSAVVVDNGHVVGIFTAVDGLKALSELLHSRMH